MQISGSLGQDCKLYLHSFNKSMREECALCNMFSLDKYTGLYCIFLTGD